MKISAINSMYINNRNFQTKSQIKFGEAEDFWANKAEQKPQKISSKEACWIEQKNQIEERYRKQIENLSRIADESGMRNDVFWDNIKAIQNEKDIALRQAKIYFEYKN